MAKHLVFCQNSKKSRRNSTQTISCAGAPSLRFCFSHFCPIPLLSRDERWGLFLTFSNFNFPIFTLSLFHFCTLLAKGKRWVRVSKIPKRHRCDTSLG